MSTTTPPPHRLPTATVGRILRDHALNDDDRRRLAVCFHEAGHAVAAVLHGGRVRQSTIWPAGHDKQGSTEFDRMPEVRRADIFYAGPWAEARWKAGTHPGPVEIAAAFACGGHFDERALIASGGVHLGMNVAGLLTRTWPAVVRLARNHLFYDGAANHADVCAALGLSDDGGPGSAELAAIRAGLLGLIPFSH